MAQVKEHNGILNAAREESIKKASIPPRIKKSYTISVSSGKLVIGKKVKKK